MASIRLSDLYDRAGQIRSDLLPAQIQAALVEAARSLAIDTGIVEDVIPFTLEEGMYSYQLDLPANRVIQSFKRVEAMDADGKWGAMDGPALSILGRTPPESVEPGTPGKWTSLEGVLLFECPTDADMALRATVAYIPDKNDTPDTIAFPAQAQDALVAKARAHLWSISGREQNLKMEAVDNRAYRSKLPRICNLADLGNARVPQSVNASIPME